MQLKSRKQVLRSAQEDKDNNTGDKYHGDSVAVVLKPKMRNQILTHDVAQGVL